MIKFLSTVVFTFLICLLIVNTPTLAAWLTIGAAFAAFFVLLSDDAGRYLRDITPKSLWEYCYRVVSLYVIWACYTVTLCTTSMLLTAIGFILFFNLIGISLLFALKRFV